MVDDFLALINNRLSALAAMPPIHVEAVDDSTGEIRHWFTGGAMDVPGLRLLSPEDSTRLRALVAAELMRWTRAVAATRRVWQVRERQLREWKAARILFWTTAPEGQEEAEEPAVSTKAAKVKAWKAPSKDQVEAHYRTEAPYGRMNAAVERAEEAHTSCAGVVDVYQTLERLLTSAAEDAR